MAILAAVVLSGRDDGREDQHGGGDHPQVARLGPDGVFERIPHHRDRDGADDHVPAHPVVQVVTPGGNEDPAQPRGGNAGDIAGEVDHDGSLGAELGDGGEGRAGIVVEKEAGDDRQVRRGRHRQKLGQPLDD